MKYFNTCESSVEGGMLECSTIWTDLAESDQMYFYTRPNEEAYITKVAEQKRYMSL